MRDKDIRVVLKSSNHFRKLMTDPTCKVVDEIEILQGRVRADILVVNGHLHGYEIKSAYDDLARLPNQVLAYSKVFEYTSVVLAEKHLEPARKLIPKWWGIYTIRDVRGQPLIVQIKREKKNINVDKFETIKLLWKNEILKELDCRGLLDNKIKYKPKKVLWEKLAKSISTSEVMGVVRLNLKSRVNWRVA